jgi:hypothetical protein
VSAEEDEHVKIIASAAGKAAAREMLLLLGIDASTPAGIQRAQRNWVFLDDLRVGTTAVKRKIFVGVFGAIITALLAYMALGMGFKSTGH